MGALPCIVEWMWLVTGSTHAKHPEWNIDEAPETDVGAVYEELVGNLRTETEPDELDVDAPPEITYVLYIQVPPTEIAA